MRNRGQSEMVGFVLVFGMILLTLSIVAATGYAGLENAREFERTNNAQRAMRLLTANIEDVTQGTPSRTTELKLAEATLGFGNPVTITITGERVGEPAENFTHSTTVQPLVYDPGTGTRVVYVSGALIREQDRSAVMVHEPGLVLTNQTAVVPIIRTNASQNGSVGGSTTALVHTDLVGSEVVRANATKYRLTLNVTSPRADAWYRYLVSHPAVRNQNCSRNGTTVSCTMTTQRISVTVDRIRVAFA